MEKVNQQISRILERFLFDTSYDIPNNELDMNIIKETKNELFKRGYDVITHDSYITVVDKLTEITNDMVLIKNSTDIKKDILDLFGEYKKMVKFSTLLCDDFTEDEKLFHYIKINGNIIPFLFNKNEENGTYNVFSASVQRH